MLRAYRYGKHNVIAEGDEYRYSLSVRSPLLILRWNDKYIDDPKFWRAVTLDTTTARLDGEVDFVYSFRSRSVWAQESDNLAAITSIVSQGLLGLNLTIGYPQ